jgi:SAM-dependent methyltransferase
MENRNAEVNRKQKEFYDFKRKNRATKIWSYFRNGVLNKTKKRIGIEQQVLQLHKSWFGELKNKKVLDLGCYAGNSLSFYLASNSRQYVGLDLSEKGVEKLGVKLKDISTATVICGDFLSPEFSIKDFDLIYAYGVLHHFKNTNELIGVLRSKLKPGGQIISYDPLETSMPIKVIRSLYRPFQSDKDWEWPFSKKVYYNFANSFEIMERRGVLGKSKWFFLLEILPLSSEKKLSILKEWHKEDWKISMESDKKMFQCMHLTMLMERKSER